jgi:hypothetical protein
MSKNPGITRCSPDVRIFGQVVEFRLVPVVKYLHALDKHRPR